MKRRDVIKRIKEYGFTFDHHGGGHDIYRDSNNRSIAVPRHNEINEMTAEGIIKQAKKKP